MDETQTPRRPPSRRRPILSAFSGAVSFVLVAAIAGAFGVGVALRDLRAPGPLAADKVVTIPARTEVPEIVSELANQGVIKDSLLFNVALVVEGKRSKVHAGEYLFKKSASMQSVIDAIVSGRQLLHSITIPEGLTSEQVMQRLIADDVLAGEVTKAPAEGSLLPETYKFVRGAARARLIREMERAADRTLQEVWNARSPDNPLKTPFELLTLASMVEKETGQPAERPLIAGVFLNRLKRGMRLQSDPTVVYGLVGGKGTLGSGITKAELLRPTPYNTYLIDGLPPGPICNPGRAALEAAAHPAHTNDLYFVADGSGGHAFSATLAEHDKHVQHWREIEKTKNAAEGAVDHVQLQDVPLTATRAGSIPASAGVRLPGARPRRRGSQRGDLSKSEVFGSLMDSFDSARLGYAPGGAFASLATIAPSLNKAASVGPASGRSDHWSRGASQFSLGSAMASLGFDAADMGEPQPRVALDGPADDPSPNDIDPAYSAGAASASERPVPSLPPINGHPRIIDASVGTPLDPLKNTTWDLNSPKVVPSSFFPSTGHEPPHGQRRG